MTRKILQLVLMLAATAAGATEPQPGLWWSPQESGRGYSIDPQGELMVVLTFAYDNNGRMQWYIASGPLTNNGTHFSAPMLKYDFGQPLNGGYRFPSSAGSDGTMVIDFTSRTTALLTLPAGGQVSIQRENFGVGDPPQALLGQWLFAYTITTSFADRFSYTTVGSATSTGNGVALDLVRNATAEYQVNGPYVGEVVGFQFTSSGGVINQYLWTLQLEEGRGAWVSPSSGAQYGMLVYKTQTAAGTPKREEAGDPVAEKGVAVQVPRAVSIESIAAINPGLGKLAREHWEALSRGQR